jgi:choline-sulfatase
VRAAYYALCTFLDAQIGRILDALAEAGATEDTAIVYTTDHGEHLGRHGLWHKKTFLEDSVRVPLVLAHPDVEGGQRRPNVVSLVDVAATLVDWAQAPEPRDFDGASLRGLLEDAGAPWAETAISELVGTHERVTMPHRPIAGSPWRMLREGRYKLNYFHGGPPELYDLETDPEEWHDLAADPAYRPLLAEMTRRVLAGWDPEEIDREVDACMRRCEIIMKAETTYLGAPPVAKSLG